MQITVRALIEDDQKQALWVEVGAMPHNTYLADVWDLFMHTIEGADGDLLGAWVDDTLVGIGKITHLYGNYGWLETLRVHPDWQRKGVGTALWKQFFIEMQKMQLRAVGMYTENDNIISKTLAEQFGLSVTCFYAEHLLPTDALLLASTSSPQQNNRAQFQPVLSADGEDVCAQYYADMPPYLVINRTFYPVKNGLGKHLAHMGWLYQDQSPNHDGHILIAGNRFHPQRLLHIPYFSGSATKTLDFAQQLAIEQQAPALSCLMPIDDSRVKQLTPHGFQKADTFMTLWIDL